MPFRQAGHIRYYGFNIFDREGLFNAVITRDGGVSPAPWNSLNLGGSGGDIPSRVLENRSIVYKAFHIDPARIFDVWQVHSDQVVCANGQRPAGAPYQKADAIITNNSNILLLMLFADCVPIILFDPVRKVTGIAHAGWKGTVLKIVAKTIEKMKICYGSQPADILAAIGPSIGPDHYEVGKNVIQELFDAFGSVAENFINRIDGKVKLNLWESNRFILEAMGVARIEVSGLCTACHPEDWYSHRAEHGKTGRFGVLIGQSA